MDDKEFYLDAIRDVVPEHKEEQIQDVFYSFLELEHLYDSAIELVKTQLNIFDNEFSMRFQRNPIHNIRGTTSRTCMPDADLLWNSLHRTAA